MSTKYKEKGKNYRARNKNDHDDFFPTYHALTRLLLDNLEFDKNDSFLEPCAGAGDIMKILLEYGYNNLTGIDINPRIKGILQDDFFKISLLNFDNIITNPPFKLSVEFFKRSCEIAKNNICFIWPLDYLHGVERYDVMYENGCNGFYLKTCYPFVRRPLFDARYRPDGPMPTGATSFAWFHFQHRYQWEHGLIKPPELKWLHNNDQMGVPIEVDQIMMQDLEA